MNYQGPRLIRNCMNLLVFDVFSTYELKYIYLRQNNVSHDEKLFLGQTNLKDFSFGHHYPLKYFLAKSWPRFLDSHSSKVVNLHNIAYILTFESKPDFCLGQVAKNIQKIFSLGQKMSWPMGKSISYIKNAPRPSIGQDFKSIRFRFSCKILLFDVIS